MIVIGTGDNIEEAQKNAYEQVKHIKSEQLFYRNDIGHKALKAYKS
ncbi:phosphoribosylamine--glycine ligase [Staphylococcus aureus]|nr:phosphoribosylamine--glycine ligase [Staphylococcus aureus]